MMKLFVALALAAPSALGPSPPKVSTHPSCTGPVGYDQDHGERRGQSEDLRARPASITPARTKAKELETQARAGELTFKCYGADVMVPSGSSAVCDG